MRRLLVLLVLLVPVACSNEGSPAVPVKKTTTTSSTQTSGGTSSTATTPTSINTSTTTPKGPGIPLTGRTGSGTLTWSVNAARSEFCYRIVIKDVGAATQAWLRHTDGDDIVLTLVAPGVDGTVNTCTPSDAITVQELQTTPAAFYVQVKADKGTLQGALK